MISGATPVHFHAGDVGRRKSATKPRRITALGAKAATPVIEESVQKYVIIKILHFGINAAIIIDKYFIIINNLLLYLYN